MDGVDLVNQWLYNLQNSDSNHNQDLFLLVIYQQSKKIACLFETSTQEG